MLEIAEKNLNHNLDNKNLTMKFIATAQKVKANLEEHYGDQWSVPSQDQEAKSESTAVQSDSEGIEEIDA